MSIKGGAKTKKLGVAGSKVGQTWHRDNCSHAKKVQQKYIDIACKAKCFPPYLRQAAKIYVATSHDAVRQETIEISGQRTAFVWFFCTRGQLMSERLWQTELADHCINKPLKSFAGHTGDWFDVKTASICTTDLWDALKSFILTSLKIKVAPYPLMVSLDTLNNWQRISGLAEEGRSRYDHAPQLSVSAKQSFQLWYPGGQRWKWILFLDLWVKWPSKCFSNTESTTIIASRDEKRCNTSVQWTRLVHSS